MKTICLHFWDILELIEFSALTKTEGCEIDVKQQTLTGALSEAQLELALHGFAATLVENHSPVKAQATGDLSL